MKSKAPLVMMEQMVMILVFALAAALCLQAFVLSDSISQENQRRDQAALLCQNLAEQCKALGYGQTDAHPILTAGESAAGGEEGSYVERKTSGPASLFYYDENGQQMKEPAVYRLEAVWLPSEYAALNRGQITAYDQESGKELFSLEFAWQNGGGING